MSEENINPQPPSSVENPHHSASDLHSLVASCVFEEFLQPETTKDRRKYLRSLAKASLLQLAKNGAGPTLLEQVTALPHDFKVLQDYDEFQDFLSENGGLFDNEPLMRLRSQGILGYYKRQIVVVFPITVEPELIISEVDPE
jgi:hypothetical protein